MNSGPGPVDNATYPDLAGKVAVVTGGSRGIGAATARALARNQVSVAVVGRDEAALSTVAGEINRGGGRALAVAADCAIEAELVRLRDRVHEHVSGVVVDHWRHA